MRAVTTGLTTAAASSKTPRSPRCSPRRCSLSAQAEGLDSILKQRNIPGRQDHAFRAGSAQAARAPSQQTKPRPPSHLAAAALPWGPSLTDALVFIRCRARGRPLGRPMAQARRMQRLCSAHCICVDDASFLYVRLPGASEKTYERARFSASVGPLCLLARPRECAGVHACV